MRNNVNWQGLENWYFESIEANQESRIFTIALMKYFLRIIFGVLGLSFLISLLTKNFDTALKLFLVSLIPLSLIVIFKLWQYSLFIKFKIFKKYNGKTKIDVNDIPNLKEIINQIFSVINSNHFEKDSVKINCLLSNSNTYYPSIEEGGKNNFYLTIPKNLVFLITTKPLFAKTLIAHEIGHIIQDDVNTWKLSGIFSKFSHYFLIPINVAFFIFYAVYNYSIGLSFQIFGLVGWIFLISQILNLGKIYKNERQTSEELADTAAILYSDGNLLIECLKKYTKKRTQSKNYHPPLIERIAMINDKIKIIKNCS